MSTPLAALSAVERKKLQAKQAKETFRAKQQAKLNTSIARLSILHAASKIVRNKAASGVATRGNNVPAVLAQLLTKAQLYASPSPSSAPEPASDDGFYYSDEEALAEQLPALPPPPSAAAPVRAKPPPTPVPPTLPPAPPPQPPTKPSLLFELLDLCTGIGCFAHALRSVVCNVLAYCEIDQEAVAILKSLLHRGQLPKAEAGDIFPDVKALLKSAKFLELMARGHRDDPSLRLLPLLITAGWPCQELSPRNQHKPEVVTVAKSGLLVPILSVCASLRPDMVVLENVPNGWEKQGALIRRRLEEAGYIVEEVRGAAHQLGFPQVRERLFVVAVLKSSKFICAISSMPFASLTTLLPTGPAPHHRERVDCMPVYSARRHGLGNSVIPACVLQYAQEALFECLKRLPDGLRPTFIAQPPAKPASPPHVVPACFNTLSIDSSAYRHPDPNYWPRSKTFDPANILPPGPAPVGFPSPTCNVACSHFLTCYTKIDPDCIWRFANVTAACERGLPWQWAVAHVEHIMGVPVGWTHIEPRFWEEALAARATRSAANRAAALEKSEGKRLRETLELEAAQRERIQAFNAKRRRHHAH